MSQTVAITGVTRGIGEGLARRFIALGSHVVGIGRAAPIWFENYRDQTQFVECDFSKPSMVETVTSRISKPIDILLCNAASFGADAFHLAQTSHEALTEVFAVNVISPVLLAVALRPQIEQGSRKLIIMMSTGNASLAGNTEGTMLGYRCSKTALNQAVRTMAAEWGPNGITTVALNPGWVRTDMGGPNAPLSVDEASHAIVEFSMNVAQSTLNGKFLNTDGSHLPW
jgi:NAD(P)-dependent dehydrogenase (short-subunit alcohol dehydrogenase family)